MTMKKQPPTSQAVHDPVTTVALGKPSGPPTSQAEHDLIQKGIRAAAIQLGVNENHLKAGMWMVGRERLAQAGSATGWISARFGLAMKEEYRLTPGMTEREIVAKAPELGTTLARARAGGWNFNVVRTDTGLWDDTKGGVGTETSLWIEATGSKREVLERFILEVGHSQGQYEVTYTTLGEGVVPNVHAAIRAPLATVQAVLEKMAQRGQIGGFKVKVRDVRGEAREMYVYGNDGEEYYPFRDRMERIFREMGASGIAFPAKGTKFNIGRVVRYRRSDKTQNFTRTVPRGSTAGSGRTGPEYPRAEGATGRVPPGDTGTGSGSGALVPRAVEEEREQGEDDHLVPLEPEWPSVQGLRTIGGRFLPIHATPLTKAVLMIRYIQDVLDGKRVLQPGEAAALAAAEAAFGDWPILKRYIEDVLASKRVLQPGEAAALRLDDAPALSGDEVRLSTLQPGEEFMFDGERWRVTRGRSNAGNVRVEKVSASGEPQGEWWREYSPDLVVTYAPSGEQLPFPWTDLPDVVPGAAILAPEPKRGWKQVAVPVLIRRDIYRDIEVGRKMPCPMCGRHEVRPFMYGLSPLEGTVNISHDDVRFGGCDIFSDSPSWGCKACGHEW